MATLRTTAVFVHRHGGPEVLQLGEMDVPEPGAGELRIVQHAIGLNFADIYQRSGDNGPHSTSSFPVILGSQGAGVIESIGPNVEGFFIGQEVAYLHPGAYAQTRLVPAERTIPLPEGLSLESAAATLLRGMTAEYLLHRLFQVKAGQSILVHAAAGGMGQILSAWGRALGAEVIGTVGSAAKCEVALEHGCHHVIDYREENFSERVMEITRGAGVAVVYDAVGKDVFFSSLDCLAPLGMAINYGTASGDVQGLDLQRLHSKSLTVCRPTLRSFVSTAEALRQSADTFAAAVRTGKVRAQVSHRYRLDDVQTAHIALESRLTTGAAILIP